MARRLRVPSRDRTLWKNMVSRCKSGGAYQAKYRSYLGCAMSDNFRMFDYFSEWANCQVGFHSIDKVTTMHWSLDKDVLSNHGKVYSEDVCVFIPSRINSFFIRRDSLRGEYPIGVHWNERDSRFIAKCGDTKGGRIYLGLFKTAEGAFQAYKTCKERLAADLAEEFNKQVDDRVITALSNFSVNIDD